MTLSSAAHAQQRNNLKELEEREKSSKQELKGS